MRKYVEICVVTKIGENDIGNTIEYLHEGLYVTVIENSCERGCYASFIFYKFNL